MEEVYSCLAVAAKLLTDEDSRAMVLDRNKRLCRRDNRKDAHDDPR